MNLDDARHELREAAKAFATAPSDTRLIVAAVTFARLIRETAAGVPAAKAEEARDKKRGVILCPSCAMPILPSHDTKGVVWLNKENFQIHRCGR